VREDEEDANDVLVVYSVYDSTSNVSSMTNCVSVANRPINLSWPVVLLLLFVLPLLLFNRRKHRSMLAYVIIIPPFVVSEESWALPFFKLAPSPATPPLATLLLKLPMPPPRLGVPPRGRRSNECNRPTILVRR
jgi:hypothetical protein